MTNVEKATRLATQGFYVFPVAVRDGKKTPLTKNGHLDATLDPGLIQDWFIENPNAEIGVDAGRSGVVALDIDDKHGKDGFESLETAWLIPPETFGYDTPNGGRHLVYLAPEGKNLAPSANYRGLPGVDIRGGSSWVHWNGDAPESREEFAPAPQWMLDEKKVTTGDRFTGTIKEWYDTLEPGEPSEPVNKAMDRARESFSAQGNDLTHSDIVGMQHEAVRLGAEGQPGVPELLDLIEELTLSREGEHSRDPDEYENEYQEALASGIKKHGEAIELRKNLPEYRLSDVPDSVPNSQVTGAPGGKTETMSLVRNLAEAHTDEMTALSILWNAPVTKNTARSWGLDFVFKLVQDAGARVKEPDLPVAMRDEPEVQAEVEKSLSLLTPAQRDRADEVPTFVDRYLQKVEDATGFVQPAFSTPLAWHTLSMALGTRGIIKRNTGLPTNLWFVVLGYSGTGKSVSTQFSVEVLNHCVWTDGSYWNTGSGSPEGIVRTLVQRPDVSTAFMQDEAAGFYKNLISKDWMESLPGDMADWYMGNARAPQKVNLKELAGKTATVSFNFFTISTPEETLRVLDESFFATGFMARPVWVFGPPARDNDERYEVEEADLTTSGTSRQALELSADLITLSFAFPQDRRTPMFADKDAKTLLEEAHRTMNRANKRNPKYESIIEPSVKRLDETMWKCASLLAMARGSDRFDLDDALVALRYGEEWYANLLKVSREIAGSYLRDAKLIVDFVRKSGGRASRPEIIKEFGFLIKRNRSELTDRLDYLVESNQLVPKNEGGKSFYEIGE